ncbi:MAG: energy transducer TonB family protein, partial [Planctomycetota bacterium]
TPSPGQPGVPGDAEATRGRARDLRARYIAGVLARIHAAKRYPQQARWRGEEGLAEVAFTIEADGRVSTVELVKPSGRPLLDAEARAMVRRAAPFEEIPRELGSRIRLVVPVRFELKTGR